MAAAQMMHHQQSGSLHQPRTRVRPGVQSARIISARGSGRAARAAVKCRDAVEQASTVLVGDIGGTNARLSVWRADGPHASAQLFAKIYPTSEFHTFDSAMAAFLKDAEKASCPPPHAAALAVAGAVKDNACSMTNMHWLVDGTALDKQFGIRVQVLNDFEAVGYGIPVLGPHDMVTLNSNVPKPHAPKVVMGPGTGLGAAQLMWDEGLQDYKVWPGEGAHATFSPRGWKQAALATYAANKLKRYVEIEDVACGSGLQLIYEFLLSDEPANRMGVQLGKHHAKSASDITKAALSGEDLVAAEAVDMFMAIVGAEAGAMALRCLAQGGVYIAGGITPRLLPRLRSSASAAAGGGALLEGFLSRNVRPVFVELLASMPLAVITNGQVGQIGARQVAIKLLQGKSVKV